MCKIGIFFIINNNEIISDSISYDEGRYLNGLYDSNVDHWRLFDSLSYKFNTDDYIEVPRGRAIYNESNDNSIIYLDKFFLSNDEVLDKIIEVFRIKKYVLKTDTHYQCPNCLEDIWKD
ncbi:hypothetical protein IGK80_002704 [Enterococcus sp. DIV0609]|uniref:hypothetical protein n=1 Tax=unclassified Enterococcus TaxID=2608891 RepID=UPI003F2700D1